MNPRPISAAIRSRSLRTGLAAALLLAMASASTASAAKPPRGCGEGFSLMTFYQFRAFAISLGNDPALYPAEPGAGWIAADSNGDGLLCIKDIPNNRGTLDGLAFVGVDNTANR